MCHNRVSKATESNLNSTDLLEDAPQVNQLFLEAGDILQH
jgi:hypothetical protein